ncbi:A/G-specific adenine glycosylase [Legionella hackeliae]|uniref:Adenine DNA glycosylase n=1 Tax=Legionella hackeliae TaxID=449 RepID=A0A0A8UVF3_LEGHA|nr:A/G-specific adenine glycosylase [Legionella hackeliae]KTD09606.1 A/G specific adenine glycosylase [Legionella hackeliae]CEK11077.1 A/G-specific adenine glycosylase [Legionella hackeliae]STX47824.1 A/G-specific adenine glycosylase [Legionella hackeliae]
MIRQLHEQFSQPLLAWFDQFGRKDLPWQNPRNPYRVWVSEIMLQQTQVKTVIPYFNHFMEHFPTLWDLASSPEDEVLALWSGLGYYSRARNLHKTAKLVCEHYQGHFPTNLEELTSLPGIGESTAAAIVSQAFNLPAAILDGNVKRVLCRYFKIAGWPEKTSVKKTLWRLANHCMSQERCADYTQAIMDLGATCCTSRNPNCHRCPLNDSCLAKQNDEVSQYPEKKPKKVLPHKEEQFLLLHNAENKIFLEKRPPAGLWGGLWCLPSIHVDSCPEAYIQKVYHFTSFKTRELLRLKHSFSHFHLHIRAISILTIATKDNVISENSGKWYRLSELKHLGLAKPIATIIQHFQATLAETTQPDAE